jgi:uncharacterized protein (TIGR01244 family)
MADFRKLDDTVTVAPQITIPDVAAIAAAGFRAIMNNRPDGEEPGQPDHETIAAEAARHGLAYHYVPVTNATLGPDAVAAFGKVVDEAGGAVLAHCRSGTRCAILWAFDQAKRGDRPVDEIIGTAHEAGYDIENLRPALVHFAGG